MDTSRQKLNIPYLKQANRFVEESRQKGLSQTELGAKLGMTKLHTRTILRNLVKTKIVATYMNDVGKQRVTKYISKKFEHSSEMSKQLAQEMNKMKEFNRSSLEEKNDCPPPIALEEIPQEIIYPLDNEVHIENELPDYQVRKDEQLFACVNKIFSKYKKLRSRAPFRYTFLNLSQLRATTFWNESETIECPDGQSNQMQIDQMQIEQMPIDQMQTNPVQNSNVFKDVKTKIVSSRPQTGKRKTQVIGFLENLKNSNKKNVTYRLLKRANIVIEAVKQKKVIDDTSKLLKVCRFLILKKNYIFLF